MPEDPTYVWYYFRGWLPFMYPHHETQIKPARDSLAGLVERVGVEPTRCYHRGILGPRSLCPLFLYGSTLSM